ncbi:MAG: protein kinase [Cyanobacteria bacterium J06623_7]
MSDSLDLSSYGYRITAELGRNTDGARVTWQAESIQTQQNVVVKQFCFAQAGSSWSGYQAYTQEIEILQRLSHPQIPQYLDSIETSNGFCLLQEYVEAIPSHDFRSLSLAEIKLVAERTLDILVYLQQQVPPILHRNISSANILLDTALNVYLIDFGFASWGLEDVVANRILPSAQGFMAPEQMSEPCLASDLYSLGLSLIYLLSDRNLPLVLPAVDDFEELNLISLLPDLAPEFRTWLAKMIRVKVSQRFTDAKSARIALRELDPALTWEDDDNPSQNRVLAREDVLEPNSLLKPKIVGGLAIASVTMVATRCVDFAASRVELTFNGVAIAILATLAISVTQLGAAGIVSSEPQAKVQGIILSGIIPIILVGASSLIWGAAEAVIIAVAIAWSEVLLLSYVWGRLFVSNFLVRGSLWLGAVALGLTVGLVSF